MTDRVREQPPGAVDASRTVITWPKIARTLAVAGGVGAFLSFVGAFGTYRIPFPTRTAIMVAFAWIGATMGLGAFILAGRLPFTRSNPLIRGLTGGLVMFAPMGVVVWGGVGLLNGHMSPLAELPDQLFGSLVISVAMSLLAVLVNRRRTVVMMAPTPPTVKFLDRLPLKLRGAEVWAVEAEDHYLRLHTSKGQDLILMRLADAIAELEGIEGVQTHRSWWVARDGIVDARRGDGRATLTLKDGAEAPVSRTHAGRLRELRWI
ncbi:MAG: hypothetical protein JWO33_995 [Caulobacteraceae bacterium]|nr:hypothetical protein [Caulobacteraceae bacterium]